MTNLNCTVDSIFLFDDCASTRKNFEPILTKIAKQNKKQTSSLNRMTLDLTVTSHCNFKDGEWIAIFRLSGMFGISCYIHM